MTYSRVENGAVPWTIRNNSIHPVIKAMVFMLFLKNEDMIAYILVVAIVM